MRFFLKKITQEIPKGIHLISWATTIRWVGWGFFEALLPVFMFSFASSYAETGLFRSVYDIVFLLTLPLAGMLADRVAGRTLIIIGLLIYPFVGFGYFLTGLTGLAILIVITRILNGVSYAFDVVGRDTYFRNHAPANIISSVFGYFETLTNFWWVVAVLASTLLVSFLKIHWIALAIVPTSLIALGMVFRVRSDHREGLKDGLRRVFHGGIYMGIWREIQNWSKGLKLLAFINFFLGMVATIGEFFIPLYSYSQGESLPRVILITAVLALPAVFGGYLGRFADHKKRKALFIGLGLVVIFLFLLGFIQNYLLQLVAAFVIGVSLELAELTSEGMGTRMTKPKHYGRLSSAMEGIRTSGELVSPVLLGFLIDDIGISYSFRLMSFVIFGVLLIVWWRRKWFSENLL